MGTFSTNFVCVAVCGLLALSSGFVFANDPQPTPPYIVLTNKELLLEQKLALINANKGSLPSDDITIARFRYLLEKAAAKTGDTQKQIADDACRGQGVLREDGKNTTILEFMEAVNKFLSVPGLPKMTYREAAARVLTAISEQ